MDQVFATSIEMSVEFGDYPRTPTPNTTPNPHTPISVKSEEPQPKSPSPKKRGFLSNLKKTFRSRSTDSGHNDGCGSPQSVGHRKSIRSLFTSTRTRRPCSNSDIYNNSVDCKPSTPIKRPSTVSPHKDFVYSEDFPALPRRRKSLGDMIGTMSKKVSLRRGSKHSPRLVRVYTGLDSLAGCEESADGKGLSSQLRPSCDPESAEFFQALSRSRSLHGSNSSRTLSRIPLHPALTEGSRGDSFGAQASIDRIANQCKTTEPARTEQRDPKHDDSDSYYSESDSSVNITVTRPHTEPPIWRREESKVAPPNTPDSYLQFLINSHCVSPRVATPLQECQDLSRWSPTSSETSETLLPMTSLEDKNAGKKRDNSLLRDLSSQEALSSGLSSQPEVDMLDLETSPLREPKVSVGEIDFSSEFSDIVPDFYRNLVIRNKRYQQLCAEAEEREATTHERIETSIKLTLARMTKNFHMSTSSEEDFITSYEASYKNETAQIQLDRNEVEMRDAMAIGEKILDEKKAYRRLKSYPSSDNLANVVCMDRTLEDSVLLRAQVEPTVLANRADPGKEGEILEDSTRENVSSVSIDSSKGALGLHETGPERGTFDVALALDPFKGPSSRISNLNLRQLQEENAESLELHEDSSYPTEVHLSGQDTHPGPRRRRHVSSAPVQVLYPQITNSWGPYKQVYESKSKAMTALCEENRGEWDSFCTYDPKARVISMHLLNTFIPDFAELDQRGLEIIWIPMRDKPISHISGPALHLGGTDCSLGQECGNFRSDDSDSAFSADIYWNRPTMASSEEVDDSSHRCSIYDAEMDFIGPMLRPTPASSLQIDPRSPGREDSSVFNDDFFLEVDPEITKGYLGSQYSEPSSSMVEKRELLDLENVFGYDSVTEILYDFNDEDCKADKTKTWAELGKEYLARHPSRTLEVSNSNEDILEPHSSKCTNPVQLRDSARGSMRSLSSSSTRGYCEHIEDLEFDQKFIQELNEAQNRVIQQVIDELVANRSSLIHREMALTQSKNTEDTTLELVQPYPAEEVIDHGAQVGLIFRNRPPFKFTSHSFNGLKAALESTSQTSVSSDTASMPRNQLLTPTEFKASNSGNAERKHSAASDASFASGFKFTAYSDKMMEAKNDETDSVEGNGVRKGSVVSIASGVEFTAYSDELVEAQNDTADAVEVTRSMGSSEPLDICEDAHTPDIIGVAESGETSSGLDGSLKEIAAQRPNTKSMAPSSKPATQDPGKVGALIDIFQSHGLMQPGLRSILYRPLPQTSSSFTHKSSTCPATTISRIVTPSSAQYCSSGIASVAKASSPSMPSTGRVATPPPIFPKSFSEYSDYNTEGSSTFGENLERMCWADM